MHWLWLENLTKPFASLFNPIAERIGTKLGTRKPRLHVHPIPTQLIWLIGGERQQDGTMLETMQVHITAAFAHDDEKQTLVIMDAFPVGTSNRIPSMSSFVIPPGKIVDQTFVAFVHPVVAEKGKPWTGRLIFVDQFHRRYKSQKMSFRCAMPPTPIRPQPPKTPPTPDPASAPPLPPKGETDGKS